MNDRKNRFNQNKRVSWKKKTLKLYRRKRGMERIRNIEKDREAYYYQNIKRKDVLKYNFVENVAMKQKDCSNVMGNRIKRKFCSRNAKLNGNIWIQREKKEQIFHDGYIFLKMETMSPY